MIKKLFGILICMLLITTVLPATGLNITKESVKQSLRLSDALIPPDADKRAQSVNLMQAPGYYETSEYMIGSIAVGETCRRT